MHSGPAPQTNSGASSRGRALRPYVFLVLANLFWAGNFVFAEGVVRELSPLQLTFYRWLLAAPLLIGLALVIERPRWRAALRHWKFQLGQSLLGVTGFTLFTYEALKLTSSVNAALTQAINPPMIVLCAALIFHTVPRKTTWLGLTLSLLGVSIVLLGPQLSAGSFSTESINGGVLLMLGAVVCWTLYSVLGRRNPSPPITSTAIQATFGVFVLLPVMAFTGFSVSLSAAGTVGLAYIVIFPAVLSLVLWNTAVRDVGPTRASGFLNLLPIFTAALAVTLGAELAWPQIIGGCLVIAGVFVTSRVPINRREVDAQTIGQTCV